VYLDGDLIFENVEIDEREGVYGILLNGSGEEAKCEGRNIWVFQAPRFEPGVCKILATNTVNKRSGPGTNNAQMGKLDAGKTARAVGQAEASSGATWWKLDDDSWVREDIVTAQGDCHSLPVVDS